jgi:hypothetical protein
MAIVMVMGISRTAEAVTANEMSALCKSPRGVPVMYCEAYLEGFIEGVAAANAGRELDAGACDRKYFAHPYIGGACRSGYVGGRASADFGREINERVCFPVNFTGSQLRKMFVKSTNETPEHLHQEVAGFLYALTARPFVRSIAKGNCD